MSSHKKCLKKNCIPKFKLIRLLRKNQMRRKIRIFTLMQKVSSISDFI